MFKPHSINFQSKPKNLDDFGELYQNFLIDQKKIQKIQKILKSFFWLFGVGLPVLIITFFLFKHWPAGLGVVIASLPHFGMAYKIRQNAKKIQNLEMDIDSFKMRNKELFEQYIAFEEKDKLKKIVSENKISKPKKML